MTRSPRSFGNNAQASTYSGNPIPKNAASTKPTRTSNTGTPKRWARPPATPPASRSVLDRYNDDHHSPNPWPGGGCWGGGWDDDGSDVGGSGGGCSVTGVSMERSSSCGGDLDIGEALICPRDNPEIVSGFCPDAIGGMSVPSWPPHADRVPFPHSLAPRVDTSNRRGPIYPPATLRRRSARPRHQR